MKKYLVEFEDLNTFAVSPIDTVIAEDDYTPKDYLDDVAGNDTQLWECLNKGVIHLTELDPEEVKSRLKQDPPKSSMPEYMLVCRDPETGNVWSMFCETAEQAEETRMDGAVSLGYFVQVYRWTYTEGIGAYVMEYE